MHRLVCTFIGRKQQSQIFSRQGHYSDSCNDYIDNQRLEETITELNEANQNDGPKPTI